MTDNATYMVKDFEDYPHLWFEYISHNLNLVNVMASEGIFQMNLTLLQRLLAVSMLILSRPGT